MYYGATGFPNSVAPTSTLAIQGSVFLNSSRDDDLMLASLSVVKQLLQTRPNLFAAVEARHNRRESNQPGGDYRENAVTASLNMSF